MLSGNIAIDEHAAAWAHGTSTRSTTHDWRTIDRALRSIAKRRAALDAEEARWLREAEHQQIWRPLGMVSALDYLERALGYAPRTAQERLRVARALGDLPELGRALEEGYLPFSAVRELTRVATRATERRWIDAAVGKNLREIEDLVADHQRGDAPDDPGDPEVRRQKVMFELAPETYAALRQARALLEDEHGGYLDDNDFVAVMTACVLEGGSEREPSGRARAQVAVTVCERCRQGWQHGAGVKVAIGPAAVDRAECDAQHIGSIDAPVPGRAHQDIPPKVARLVRRRDGGRCRVPGCRSARGLELHHIVHRADGGGNDAENIVTTCSACHIAHHDGRLHIRGTASNLVVERPAVHAHVGAPDRDAHGNTTVRDDARQALVGLGWKPRVATRAVDDALTEVDAHARLETVIREALRRCASYSSKP